MDHPSRPIRNPSLKDPRPQQQQQPFPSSTEQFQNEHLDLYSPHGRGPVANDPSRWSNTQLSELHPGMMRDEGSIVDDGESVFTESARSEYYTQNRQRPHSFSTISEHPSTSSIRPRGEYHRIVIDRSNERQKDPEESLARPTLEVPILHYQLGSPQFDTTGSPVLQSSAWAHASTHGNSFLGENSNGSPLPNTYLSDSWAPDRPSFVSSILSGAGATALELGPGPAGTETPVVYEVEEPIEPSVFDDLMSEMDNESVVRYTPGTKDVSAANPARIVAEVSSESFMDYELVSDFFLTFRSYLSSSHLLALLLARLQWAINRLQDDGRIIRIRTFAALRHWILNYFVDDFVVDYDLRVYFCDTINAMYNDVKARENGGTSDLKILIDLKRCWHGKCAMCWDVPELSSAYYHADSPIIPGGVLEATDGDEEEPRQLFIQTESPVKNAVNGTNSVDLSGCQSVALTQHQRNQSGGTAKSIPVSTQSDHSFHVTSCSLPPKALKHISIPLQAPHPVPLTPTRQAQASQVPPKSSSAASRRYPFLGHAHKRSGSFSDSVRDDRAPLQNQWGIVSSQEILDPGSLIRGYLYPPAESYMTMMAPPSPPLPLSSVSPALERQSTLDGTSKGTSSASGVKTLIGSIRRAFNGAKHSAQSSASRHTRGTSSSPLRGKTSMLPNNLAFGSDYYRDRKTAMTKKPTRIDTLCDDVLKQYRQAVAEQGEKKDDPQPAAAPAPAPALPTNDASTPRPQAPPARIGSGAESGLTMGSESIVIVDDTGLDIPMVSGADGEPVLNLEQPGFLHPGDAPSVPKTNSLRVPSHNPSSRGDNEYSPRIFYDDSDAVPAAPEAPKTFFDSKSSISSSRRSISAERGSTHRKRTSPSLRLRKYASFQSGISKLSRTRPGQGSEPVPLFADPALLHDGSEKPSAGPILRRRPGGDLRKMRNGRNPLSYLRSRSIASVVDSEASTSASVSKGTVASRPQTSLIPPNPRYSLLQTNSSQDVRRSFEAAIARFAQIPDDDDGGVESTLLKLEGKWDDSGEYGSDGQRLGLPSTAHGYGDPRANRCNVPIQQNGQDAQGDPYAQIRRRLVPLRPYSDSVAESEESFSSIPLLERGLSDESMKKPALSRVGSHPATAPRAPLSGISSRNDTSDWDSSHPSMDMVKETESIRRIPRGSTLPLPVPRPRTTRLSGLSSEVSFIDRQEAVEGGRPSTDTMMSLGRSSFGIPPHPLAQPPSPPMTIQNPRSMTSCATPMNPVLAQARPLTPGPSPNRRNAGPGPSRSIGMQQDVLSTSESGQQQQKQNAPDVDHVPFILSCESQLLAQQLTLVEMAALSEIDWRDLVEMRWGSSGSAPALNWVQFLTTADNQHHHRGIDLVVGRFNLMVKWVLSEIALTTDINERVQTISKFIHTAAHAKRMCNYATMLQIAIALSSTDCSRLERTWGLVSLEDRRLLKDMEALIQPVRNFHDLRVEMETANLQEGCIPFVGASRLFTFPLNPPRRSVNTNKVCRPLRPRPNIQRPKTRPNHHANRGTVNQLRAPSHDGADREEFAQVDRCEYQVCISAGAGSY